MIGYAKHSFLPLSSVAAQQADGAPDEEEEAECWICREPGTDTEPLIQPCACRGTLSGVHAACVEQWVQHQRQNSAKSEPRCATCNQLYTGQEEAAGFLKLLVDTAAMLQEPIIAFIAFMFPGAALAVHQDGFAAGFQCVIVALFYMFVCHKSAVITVSLGSEPRSAFLRRFYISHPDEFHGGYTKDLPLEAVAVLVGCHLKGWGALPCLLPILAIAIVPMMMLMSRTCFSEVLLYVACVLFPAGIYAMISNGFLPSNIVLVIARFMALIVALAILKLAWLHKHPLDAGPHLAVTVLALVLGLSGQKLLSALALAFHALFMVAMLYILARAGLKLQCANDGLGWWLALTIQPFPFLFRDVTFTAGQAMGDNEGMVALSLVWASLMLALCAAALWHELLGALDSWKVSNKVFRLSSQQPEQKIARGSELALSTNV